MVEDSPKELFNASLARCELDKRFIPNIYTLFFSSSEAIKSKFLNTDFSKQNEMLLHSLKLASGTLDNNPESMKELRIRARTHDRDHMNIDPSYYGYWLGSVIASAKQADPKWNSQTENAWRTVLSHVIHFMIRRY